MRYSSPTFLSVPAMNLLEVAYRRRLMRKKISFAVWHVKTSNNCKFFFRPHVMVVGEGAYSDPVHLWESDVSEQFDFAICSCVSVHMEGKTDLTESALPFN